MISPDRSPRDTINGCLKLEEYCRTGKITDVFECHVPNLLALHDTKKHVSENFQLAGMPWAVEVEVASNGNSLSEAHLSISLCAQQIQDTPQKALPHADVKFTIHPLLPSVDPVSAELTNQPFTYDCTRVGCKDVMARSELEDHAADWLDSANDDSLRVSVSVTMRLKDEQGIALLRTVYGMAPSAWLPSTVVAIPAAFQDAASATRQDMRVAAKDGMLNLDAELTLAEFNPTCRAAIAALLGVPGIRITHEWRGTEEPGAFAISLSLHSSVYNNAGVLRDLAATRESAGDKDGSNATRLDMPTWKVLAVLAISLRDQWLTESRSDGSQCIGSAEHITHLGVLLEAAHFLQHEAAMDRIKKSLPSCHELEQLEVPQKTALLQALHDLPLDVSAQIIDSDCSGQLATVLQLPTPFVRIWLLGRHATELHLASEPLTEVSFAALVSKLPMAPRLRRLGLNLTALSTTEPRLVATGCTFIKDLAQDGCPVCISCRQRVETVHPLAEQTSASNFAAGDSAIMQLSRAVHLLPELTHLAPLKFYLSVRNLAWLQHLFAGAPSLTHVDICALATADGANTATPCFAQLFVQSFTTLPKLEELRLTAFPGTIYSSVLDVLRGHRALKRVVIDGSLVQGAVPPSMQGIVKRSREGSASQGGTEQS